MLDILAYLGLIVFSRFVRLLPLRAALLFGAAFGRLALAVLPRRRRLVLQNLERAFPEKTPEERVAISRACAADLGRSFMEVLRMPDLTEAQVRERVRIENAEVFEEMKRAGKGTLCLSAHYGNFEYIAASTNRMGLYKSHLIGRKIKNPRVDAAIRALRSAHGVETIMNKRSTPEILSRLKRGEGIGVVLDQNMKRRVGIFVDFFGRQACTTPGLAVLAERSKALVVPIFMVRESAYKKGGDPAKHVMILSPPIPWEENPDRAEAVRRNTQRYTAVIEEWVRRYPSQWFWVHDRWKTQPVEGAIMRANALGKQEVTEARGRAGDADRERDAVGAAAGGEEDEQ